MATARSDPPKASGFVTQVVKDPAAPPEVLFLTGFSGPSSEERHTRLYFDVQLSDYVDIPDAAILHRLDQPEELAASLLWIERAAELIHGKAGGPRSKASFLEGRLAQAAPTVANVCTQLPPCSPSGDESGPSQGAQEMNWNTTATVCTQPIHCVPHTAFCPTMIPSLCASGEQGAAFPTAQCHTVNPNQCLPQTATPGCLPQTAPPGCLPPTLPPQCAPPTLPPQCPLPTAAQCPTIHPICLPHTATPGCLPHTATPGCLPHTATPGCLPHTATPGCQPPTVPPQCPLPTAQCPTVPAQCAPKTGIPWVC